MTSVSIKGYLVWIVCSLFYLYEFLLRTILGTFQGPIMQGLHLNAVEFALLSSTAYLFIYGLMQIPVGMLIDRFGLKKAMLVGVSCCLISTFGFASIQSFPAAVFFRVLMGLGSSFGFVCLLVAIYNWMPRKNIALCIGISQFIGTLGPMIAAGPLNAVAEVSVYSWREVFFILGIVAVFLFFIILLCVDKNRENPSGFIILSKPNSLMQNMRLIIKQSQIWYIAVFGAFVYFSLEYLSENEGKTFLMLNGFSSNFASYMITVSWLGFALGAPFSGYVSDKLLRRKPMLLFSAASVLFALVGIIYLPLGELGKAFCFFTLGVGGSASSIGIVILAEQCKPAYLAAGLGLNNALAMLVISLNAPIVSKLLTFYSNTPSLSEYKQAFLILIVLPLISFVLALFAIRETYGKPTKENKILNLPIADERAII